MRQALAQTLEVLAGAAITAGAFLIGGLGPALVVGGVLAGVFAVAVDRSGA